MFVGFVAETKDSEIHSFQRLAVTTQFRQIVVELLCIVGRLAFAVRRHEEHAVLLLYEFCSVIVVLEIDDGRRKAVRLRLLRHLSCKVFCRAGLRAEEQREMRLGARTDHLSRSSFRCLALRSLGIGNRSGTRFRRAARRRRLR